MSRFWGNTRRLKSDCGENIRRKLPPESLLPKTNYGYPALSDSQQKIAAQQHHAKEREVESVANKQVFSRLAELYRVELLERYQTCQRRYQSAATTASIHNKLTRVRQSK